MIMDRPAPGTRGHDYENAWRTEMESRRDTRYSITERLRRSTNISDIECELDLSGIVRCRARDISLKGVGFEMTHFTSSIVSEAKPGTKIITRVYFGGDSIMAGSIMSWCSVVEDGGRLVFRGGLMFDVISSEDRLRLYDLIGRMREDAV